MITAINNHAEYGDNSQIIHVINDNARENLIAYDTANRRSVVADHKGNTVSYTYDDNSNITSITEQEKSDLGNPDDLFTLSYEYDGLDRLIQTFDNVGNTRTHAYDLRNNRVFMDDALSNETRYVYDGINRLVKTIRDLNSDGANTVAIPGDGTPDIVTTQHCDDTSRLTGQVDDSGNMTRNENDKATERTRTVDLRFTKK